MGVKGFLKVYLYLYSSQLRKVEYKGELVYFCLCTYTFVQQLNTGCIVIFEGVFVFVFKSVESG